MKIKILKVLAVIAGAIALGVFLLGKFIEYDNDKTHRI